MKTTDQGSPIDPMIAIALLAQRFATDGTFFGKTALQKLMYFLQEVEGVDLGYEFDLYTYGPFSSELLSDLDMAAFMDVVEIEYDERINGYWITPGEDDLSKAAPDRAAALRPHIEKVFQEFVGDSARSLELLATITYVVRSMDLSDDDEVVRIVKDLKPHFPPENIRGALERLRLGRYVA